MNSTCQENARGFSLVEVTLALGIVSIALLSIVGLLGSAMDTSSIAGRDTALAARSSQVLGELRGVPFSALGQVSPREAAAGNDVLEEPLADSVYYFTQDGAPLLGPGVDAHFECVVRKAVDAGANSVSSSAINKISVVLHFTWPVAVSSDPSKRPGTSLFNASIARY